MPPKQVAINTKGKIPYTSNSNNKKEYIHYKYLSGKSPGIIFLSGYMSDMEGTKAVALEELRADIVGSMNDDTPVEGLVVDTLLKSVQAQRVAMFAAVGVSSRKQAQARLQTLRSVGEVFCVGIARVFAVRNPVMEKIASLHEVENPEPLVG